MVARDSRDIGRGFRIDSFVIDSDHGDLSIERVCAATMEYWDFFIPDLDGLTSAEKAGVIPPPWLTELVKSFREEPLPRGEREADPSFFWAELLSGILRDLRHDVHSRRVQALRELMKNLKDSRKRKSIEEARSKAFKEAPGKSGEAGASAGTEIVTPFTLIYEMKNRKKTLAVLERHSSLRIPTVDAADHCTLNISREDDGYYVYAFPQSGLVGLKIGTVWVEGNFLLAGCTTELRKNTLSKFLEDTLGRDLRFVREAGNLRSVMPDEEKDRKDGGYTLAEYDEGQFEEEEWAGKNYFRLQKEAGAPYIAIKDRKVVVSGDSPDQLMEKLDRAYGEPKFIKECPLVTETVDLLNLVYDGFMILLPRSRWNADQSDLPALQPSPLNPAKFPDQVKEDILRMWGMTQLTIGDVRKAVAVKYGYTLNEGQLYAMVRSFVKPAKENQGVNMIGSQSQSLSDSWLLISSKDPVDFCVIVDVSSKFAISHSPGVDKVRLLKAGIASTGRTPSNILTWGIKNTQPLAAVCPRAVIQRLEERTNPSYDSIVNSVLGSIRDIFEVRMRNEKEAGWLLDYAIMSHNTSLSNAIDDEPLSLSTLKEGRTPTIPQHVLKAMKEHGFKDVEEIVAWERKRPKDWLTGIWNAGVWPGYTLGIKVDEWNGESGFVVGVLDLPEKKDEQPYMLSMVLERTREKAIEKALREAYECANRKLPKVILTLRPEEYQHVADKVFGKSKVPVEYLPP